MSEAAYRDIGREMAGTFEAGEESYEGFGRVPTQVQWMGASRESARDSLYAMPDAALASHLRRGHLSWLRGRPRALYDQIRRPAVDVGWAKRLGFVVMMIVMMPVEFARILFAAPRRIIEKRALRARAVPSGGAAD